jgi:hypothetical protein
MQSGNGFVSKIYSQSINDRPFPAHKSRSLVQSELVINGPLTTHTSLLDGPKLAVFEIEFCDAFSRQPIKADVALHCLCQAIL